MRGKILILAVLVLCGCASVQTKYKRTSTGEMKFRYNQCTEFLAGEQGRFNFRFGPPGYMMFQGDPRADRIKEKEELEKELFRRFQAGDEDAYLPLFGEAKPSQSQ